MGIAVLSAAVRPSATVADPTSKAEQMSHILKDAANSTIETVSHIVDEAREHLDHLPLPRCTAARWRSKRVVASVVAAALVVVLAVGWMLRRRRSHRRAADRALRVAASREERLRVADIAARQVDRDAEGVTPQVA